MFPSSFHRTFFPSVFRSSPVRRKGKRGRCSCHVRYAWAQAEMWITDRLYCGYHPDYLEKKTREEIKISRITGEYCPCFLEFCLRILENLHRSGQFSSFPSNIEVNITDNVKIGPGSYERNFSMSQKFQDGTVVSRYGTDPEISRQIAQSEALDKDNEERLHDMRKRLHEDAEAQYHEHAQGLLEDPENFNDWNRSEYSRGSSRAPRRHQYEPKRTEIRRSEDSYDTRSQATYTDNQPSRNGASSTIYPSDSVSQRGSEVQDRIRYDLSRPRAASPPGKINQANDGSSSRASFSSVPFPEPCRRRRKSRPPVSFDMRGMSEAIKIIEERPRRFRSRARNESTLGDQRDDSKDEERPRRSTSRTRNESRSRVQIDIGRVEEIPRPSRSRVRYESRDQRDQRDRQTRHESPERENRAYRSSDKYTGYDQARSPCSPSRHRSHQQRDNRTSQHQRSPDKYRGYGQSKQNSHDTPKYHNSDEYRNGSRDRHGHEHRSRRAPSPRTEADSTASTSTIRGPKAHPGQNIRIGKRDPFDPKANKPFTGGYAYSLPDATASPRR